MLKILAVAGIAVSSAATASAQDQTVKAVYNHDQRPFLCGALFQLLSDAHAEDKNRQVFDHYSAKFNLSFERAKATIRNAGGDSDDAHLKMQEAVNSMGKLLARKKAMTGHLLSSCERS